MNKPYVKLLSATPNPLAVVYTAWKVMHNKDFEGLEFTHIDLIKESVKNEIFKEKHLTVLEFISASFILKNISRAFQQQLTRHRLASYSIQSLRVVGVGSFADSENYTLPDSLTKEQKDIFKHIMTDIQFAYNHLISDGAKVEDARGILPLNIHSPITFTMNYRVLRDMLGQRLCKNTQSEFREVAELIKIEITEKWDRFLGENLKPMCEYAGKCLMPANTCNKFNKEN